MSCIFLQTLSTLCCGNDLFMSAVFCCVDLFEILPSSAGGAWACLDIARLSCWKRYSDRSNSLITFCWEFSLPLLVLFVVGRVLLVLGLVLLVVGRVLLLLGLVLFVVGRVLLGLLLLDCSLKYLSKAGHCSSNLLMHCEPSSAHMLHNFLHSNTT